MFGLLRKKDPATTIRILMDDRGMNVHELAWESGVSVGTISRLRNGRIERPHTDTMYAIASALKVKPNDIWRDA